MASSRPSAFPWECRDKEDQARIAFQHPLRRTAQVLAEENLKLKRILRENGISWSPVAKAHLKQMAPNTRKTRSSKSAPELGRPRLPTEIILRIMKLALASPHPIVDPLYPLTPEHMSNQEKTRGNQIAIHFLVTCKALHAEGTRYLWESNKFTFTTPQALRNFSELPSHFRNHIQHVNLRIIARYFDDSRRRHKLPRRYHNDLDKDHHLKVQLRPKETPLVRGGFRCYTWSQIVDFLAALRAPYDPAYRDKTNPRPRLLPGLTSLRLDLVNFSDTMLPFSGSELHDIASHELGCTLNEIQVTGMPYNDAGMKASGELCGMLKDEGLYLDGQPAFVAHARYLQPLSGGKWCARVIRGWNNEGFYSDFDGSDDDETGEHIVDVGGYHARLGTLPPAPTEQGHPPSTRPDDSVVWKRVPASRDDEERSWIQFSRFSGLEVTDEWDSDDEGVCPCCGESHPGSSYLEFLAEQDLAD